MTKTTYNEMKKFSLEEILNELKVPDIERKKLAIDLRKEMNKINSFKFSSRYSTLKVLLETQEEMLKNQKKILARLDSLEVRE